MQHATHDALHARQDDTGDATWATLAEAASILGCSVDTVRRRIRRGELHAVQDAGRHGPTWRVLLSTTPSSTPSMTPGTQDSTPSTTPSSVPSVVEDGPALLEALRMLDAMRRENRDLAGQVGYLQARVQIQEETIRALQAPQKAQEGPQASNLTPQAPEPTTGASGPQSQLTPRPNGAGLWGRIAAWLMA